jgi:hypothetical protein
MLGAAKTNIELQDALDEIDWTPSGAHDSAKRVYAYAQGIARQAATYYQKAKRPKKRWATLLRMSALVLATLAGVIPILSGATVFGRYLDMAPSWASILIALAAGCVAIDRFFGFSNAWIRFTSAETKIRRLAEQFELEWQAEMVGWRGPTELTDDQIRHCISLCQAFVGQVADVVGEETNAWIAEFTSALKQIEDATKVAPAAKALGGIQVTVDNGDQCDGGWTVSIDGGAGTLCRGKTAAFRGLSAAVHKVAVTGMIGTKNLQGEALAELSAGEVKTVSMTLA